jgi:hypothetical protein
MILRPKSPNRSCRFWGQNWETWSHRFWCQTGRNCPNGFKTKPLTNRPSGFEAKPLINHSSGFEAKPLTNRRLWFWGSTKKPTLLISLCTVQTTHSVTGPLDRPATKYTTCVWPSPVLCNRSPTPAMILIADYHATHITCTPWDKQTQFSTRIDNWGRITENFWIQIQN